MPAKLAVQMPISNKLTRHRIDSFGPGLAPNLPIIDEARENCSRNALVKKRSAKAAWTSFIETPGASETPGTSPNKPTPALPAAKAALAALDSICRLLKERGISRGSLWRESMAVQDANHNSPVANTIEPFPLTLQLPSALTA
ncbi:MAG: hypothetical protein JW839_13805 [Candidatus Lokiarchaeota archaeon]|nr:hypothetical protein [Candidatus Lokiarchaeota archaeon]